MASDADLPLRSVLRFGLFELRTDTGELRKAGRPVKLQPQPAKVLALLAGRAGALVTREELQRAVWGEETYIAFDQALNFCIRQIRAALGDSSESPVYIETLPRRGYRFLAPVEVPEPPPPPAADAFLPPAALSRFPIEASSRFPTEAPRLPTPRTFPLGLIAGAVLVLALVATALVAWRTAASPGTPAGGRSLLAVLPFEDLSGHEWWADGLTEELITRLGGIDARRLGVIARTSSLRYKNTRTPIEQIARELHVDYLLTGSLQRSGPRIRITARLIAARDRTQLWADTYDRTAADVLDLQEEVAERVAQALTLELALELVPGATAPDPNPAAQEAYLKGRYLLRQGERAKSMAFFRRALAADPSYAPAWVGLAEATAALPGPPRETARQTRDALQRALALDPDLAEAHLRLADLLFYTDWDWEGARREYDRALALDPGAASAYHSSAASYAALGRLDRTQEQMARARELDPVSTAVRGDVGWFLFTARRYREAVEQCRQTLELAPDDVNATKCVLNAQLGAGDRAAALATARRLLDLEGAPPERRADLEREGLAAYWRWTLDSVERATAVRPVSPAERALPHLALGDREAALRDLEQAYSERAGWWLLPFLAVEPRLDPLRTEPRFRDLLRRLRLPDLSAGS